jgi:hypothetical protein
MDRFKNGQDLPHGLTPFSCNWQRGENEKVVHLSPRWRRVQLCDFQAPFYSAELCAAPGQTVSLAEEVAKHRVGHPSNMRLTKKG